MRKLTPVLILAVGLCLSCPAPGQQQTKQPAGQEPQPQLVPAPVQQPGAANQPGAAQPAAGPTEQTTPPEQTPPTRKPADFTLILLMFGALLVMIIFSSRSKKKQEAKRKEMLANLKKGDKVTSIGGIIGTIMDVREDEVVVKVDESSNTRMRFARWAIRGIGEQPIGEEGKK